MRFIFLGLFVILAIFVGTITAQTNRVSVAQYLEVAPDQQQAFLSGVLHGLEVGFLDPERTRKGWVCTDRMAWDATIRYVHGYLRTHPELRQEQAAKATVTALLATCP